MVQVKTGSWAELGDDAQTHPHGGLRRGAAHSRRHGMGRGRCRRRCTRLPTTGWASPWPPGGCCNRRPGVAKIGRMAVHRVLRGSRRGPAGTCRHCWRQPPRAAISEAVLHAQRSAEDFYLGLGFKPRGEAFEEAGIAHIEMVTGACPLADGPQEKKPTGHRPSAPAPQADRACGCRTPGTLAGRSRWQRHGCHVRPDDVPGPGPGRAARGDAAGHAEVHRRVVLRAGRGPVVLLAAARTARAVALARRHVAAACC